MDERDARARFEILEQAPTAFAAIDRKWRFVYTNPEGARQVGRTPSELYGGVLWDAFPQLKGSPFEEVFRRAMDDREVAHGEGYYEPLEGWFEIHAYPIDIGIAVHFANVTERRRQSELLARRERELARAQQIAQVGSWSWEIAGDRVEWSDETYRMLAFEEDYRPTTARMEEFVHPDDVARNWAALQQTLSTGTPYELTLRMRPRDGTDRVCHVRGETEYDANGRAIRLFGTIQDITQRIERERAAEQDKRDLQLAFRVARMANYSWDMQSPVLTWSRAYYDLLGLDPETFVPNREVVHARVHPDDLQQVGRISAEAFASLPGFEMQYRIRHEDGTWRHMTSVAEIERDADGRAIRVVGSVRDRTEEVRAERERLQLERQMQQAQKLESLGVLAGGIAHDFNNLLVGILGNASLAVTEAPAHGSMRTLLGEIEQAALRAADLTRQLLAYAGKGRFLVEPVGVSQLVEEMLTLVRSAMSRKAELHLDLGRDLPAVEADATQLRQVVMNLLTNASDALEDRPGSIVLRTGLQRVDAAYRRRTAGTETLADGTYVSLEVSDTGVGMDAETLNRIFDPFFTTKFTGRGLGLAATRGIVLGHRGAIRVQSEAGEGTTFTLLFPVIEGVATMRTVARKTATWRGSGSVLVIDDEPTVRRVARAILQRSGFHVLEAADGAEGLALYEEHRDTVSLILLDLTMPRMDGEETFRRLRVLDPYVRVVLMSGYNSQNVTSHFVGKGLAGFVQKPFGADDLEAQVRSVLDREARVADA